MLIKIQTIIIHKMFNDGIPYNWKSFTTHSGSQYNATIFYQANDNRFLY